MSCDVTQPCTVHFTVHLKRQLDTAVCVHIFSMSFMRYSLSMVHFKMGLDTRDMPSTCLQHLCSFELVSLLCFFLFVCLLEENTSDVIGNCVLLCVAGRLPSVALLCCRLSNFVAIYSNFSSNCSNFFWCPWRLLSSQMWNQVSFPSLPAHCLLFLSYPQAVRWFYSLTSFHCHTTLQCSLQWWVWLILQI